MLSPKRVKHRRVHRGSMAGKASGSTEVHFGEYGLQENISSRLHCLVVLYVTSNPIPRHGTRVLTGWSRREMFIATVLLDLVPR